MNTSIPQILPLEEQLRADIATTIMRGGSVQSGRTRVKFIIGDETAEDIEWCFTKYNIERRHWRDTPFPVTTVRTSYSKHTEGFPNAGALYEYVKIILREVLS